MSTSSSLLKFGADYRANQWRADNPPGCHNWEGSDIKQWIVDWDAKFREGDTPWEDGEPSDMMQDLFTAYVAVGSTVFEIGCGTGVNALQLSAMGYDVTASDVSTEAVRMTLESARRKGLSLTCLQFDCSTRRLTCRRTDWKQPTVFRQIMSKVM